MAGPTLKVLVSILNWNNSDATDKCLEGIASIPKSKQPDVIVTDNASDVPYVVKRGVKQSLKSFRLIINSKNLGFAGGHNPNIRAALNEGYDYVVLLNNDSEIIDKNIFIELAEAIESNPSAVAANPTILSSMNPSRIWYGGGKLSLRSGRARHNLVGEDDRSAPTAPQSVSLLTGGCLAINLHRLPLKDLLLSENYFVYWEDTDWSARAISGGHTLLYVPSARLFHLVSSSLGVRSASYIYYNIRNHFIFIRHNINGLYKWLARFSVLYIAFKYLLNISLRYKKDRAGCFKAVFYGLADGITKRSGKLERSL